MSELVEMDAAQKLNELDEQLQVGYFSHRPIELRLIVLFDAGSLVLHFDPGKDARASIGGPPGGFCKCCP